MSRSSLALVVLPVCFYFQAACFHFDLQEQAYIGKRYNISMFNIVGRSCGDNRHFAASLKNKRLKDAFTEIRIFSTGSKSQTPTVICSGMSAHFG